MNFTSNVSPTDVARVTHFVGARVTRAVAARVEHHIFDRVQAYFTLKLALDLVLGHDHHKRFGFRI